MSKFHTLKITDVRRETEDCVSLAFAVPETLVKDFIFTQGQHLTLRRQLNGEDVRRTYSICTGPDDGELRVAVKKVPGGKFSTFANEKLRVGDALEVLPPAGRFFTELKKDRAARYVAFAAGSGITPILSIMKAVITREPDSHFTLFYGNRNSESVIFREVIEGLKNEHLDRLSIHYVLTREHPGSDLFAGRITGEKCRRFAQLLFEPEEVEDFFICGPFDMLQDLRQTLKELGVPRERIHYELFTAPGSEPVKKQAQPVEIQSGEQVQVQIQLDGERIGFTMPTQGQAVLDAALAAGADLPFACKGGVCCTCRAKLESGEVEMAVNYGLEPEEVEAGFVLTCQSYPRSKELTLNFDE
jgi:ring-1,2-phenylacetyl-CoA epoxidase subunit PaaE